MSVSAAFKTLLSTKHLYQSVDVSEASVTEAAQDIDAEYAMLEPGTQWRGQPSLEELMKIGKTALTAAWAPRNPAFTAANLNDSLIEFDLPTVNTYCAKCEGSWPFNPKHDGLLQDVRNGFHHQSFYLGYDCQNCKLHIVRFLVRRVRSKLTLCGRDPIEIFPVPNLMPKPMSKFFADAHIAHNAGQTLAGLFLLRTFIEQFWRAAPSVQALLKGDPRATGDALGGIYQKSLPADFCSRFPSLSDIYGQLSAALHTADANAVLFQECSDKLLHHFEARRTFRLY